MGYGGEALVEQKPAASAVLVRQLLVPKISDAMIFETDTTCDAINRFGVVVIHLQPRYAPERPGGHIVGAGEAKTVSPDAAMCH